jgi:hypothetical protein
MKRDDAIAGLIRAYEREQHIWEKRRMNYCDSILDSNTIDVPFEDVTEAKPTGHERGQSDQPKP